MWNKLLKSNKLYNSHNINGQIQGWLWATQRNWEEYEWQHQGKAKECQGWVNYYEGKLISCIKSWLIGYHVN